MATYFARASGNINGAIWATTPTGTAATATFTASDVLCANGISTIAINVNTTVATIRNDAFNDGTNTATAGGAFSLASGVTLTANLICQNTTLMAISSAGTYTISGSVTCTGSAYGVDFSAGTLTITGAISHTGTVSTASAAVRVQSGFSALNVTGNVTGGSGGTFSGGIYVNSGSGTITITGDVTAGANGAGVQMNSGTPTITITGTVSGASGTRAGIETAGTSPTVTINGTVVGGASAPGLNATIAGTYTVTRAKASSTQPGVAASTFGVRVGEIEFADNGNSPTSGIILFTASTGNIALVQMVGGSTAGSKKTLVDPISTNYYPATGDVRSGTSYAGGTRTGTLAVPAASLVAAGVSVDATTGTAAITSTAIQSACDAAISAFGGGRLSNVATTATTGQQISDATF